MNTIEITPVVAQSGLEHPADNRKVEGSNPSHRTSKDKGDLSEVKIISRSVELGKSVLLPFGDNKRYDVAWDEGVKLVKIQCKTGRTRYGCVEFNSCSITTKNGRPVSVPYTGDADYFGVYSPELDKTYLVPVKGCPKGKVTLRYKPTKNNQKKGIRWAKDFKF
tara:strand:+ start:529 stop:1020 length:492 start_codon:yes stop_codon:yes gene_type:complete